MRRTNPKKKSRFKVLFSLTQYLRWMQSIEESTHSREMYCGSYLSDIVEPSLEGVPTKEEEKSK